MAMIIKPMPVIVGEPDFPFCYEIDQVNTRQDKQISRDNKCSVSFHQSASDFFIF